MRPTDAFAQVFLQAQELGEGVVYRHKHLSWCTWVTGTWVTVTGTWVTVTWVSVSVGSNSNPCVTGYGYCHMGYCYCLC
jgi:hypothetical protein